MKDLDPAKKILGMHIIRNDENNSFFFKSTRLCEQDSKNV